ncbi:MAG TPA: histidine phosphatase family protein [Verrucomicrobiae bacterium]|nr:histidine phosphatase family protein [Verrucomicrobiae bacterium]
MNASTRIIFVRHAQTVWNKEHRYAGSGEVPLAPEAQEQIARLTERLSHERIDAIYASPLTRCLTTIMPTAEQRHLRIIKREELRERNLGDWEGHSPREIHKTHSGYHFPESAYDGSFRVPGSEPLDHLEQRLRAIIHEVVEAHPGQHIVLATHAGLIWMLQARLVQNRPHELHWAGNCAIATVVAEHGHLLLAGIEEQGSYLFPSTHTA